MISINDRTYSHRPDMSLYELLIQDNVDIHDAVLITLNGSLVRKESYGETILNDGDNVLVIRVSTGG